VNDATLESLTRAEELVRSWKPKPLHIGEDRFADEARALIDAVTPDHGCEPLLELLRIPDDEKGKEVAEDVVAALAERPDCVEPLLRVLVAGSADGAERRDAVAADRASRALGAMDLDALVSSLLAVASGDAETVPREEAFNQLVKEGPNVIPALERLEADPELGPAATRCLEKLQEYDFLPGCGDPDATGTVGDLMYAYEEAETEEDAAYALQQLAVLLEDYDWVVGAESLEPARRYVGRVVDAFMDASGEEEEGSALDELEYFAAGCGDPGARLVREAIADVPVAPGTRRLHDFAATIATAADAPEPAASSIADAATGLSVTELRALTHRPSFRRIQGALLDVMNRPDFLEWERPEELPPLTDRDSHEGFIYLALSALCNDADEEFKAIAGLTLLGDREAVPFLRRLVDDPVGGEWVRRVIGWDAELAAVEGVDLETWAAAFEPEDGEELIIDAFFGEVRPRATQDGAADGTEGQAVSPAVQEPPEELADQVPGETGGAGPPELASEPTEPSVAPFGPTEPPEPMEPMEPPGLASMDEAFDELVRRMEREPGG
jgi:hypothetical protein